MRTEERALFARWEPEQCGGGSLTLRCVALVRCWACAQEHRVLDVGGIIDPSGELALEIEESVLGAAEEARRRLTH